ncbi:MAG: hypothetical protein R3B81_02705 [bacterium]
MSALLPFVAAPLAVAALVLGWVGVQLAWRRCFPGPDPDALAERRGCAGCSCANHGTCHNRSGAPAHPEDPESVPAKRSSS